MSLRTLARGGALGTATLVLEKGASLLLVIALARVLSPLDYGRYSFIVAYLTLFQVLADLGIEPILLRRLSQEPAERERWMANALGLRIALATVSALVAVACVPFAAGEGGLAGLAALGAIGLLFSAQPGYRALFRSELRLGELFAVALLANAVMLVLVAIALVSGGGPAGVFVAIAVANLLGFALASVVARGLFRFRLAFDLGAWRELLHEAWPVGANLFVITLGVRVAAVLLMRFRGPIEVGYLSSASRLVEALNLVADGLMLVVFPLFARLAVERLEAVRALAALCTKVLGLALLAAILFVSELAPLIMTSLFGEEFLPAAPALVLLSWSALLAAVGTVYANLLVALGRQRVLFALNAISAVGQVLLQLFLVSRYGLLGAAAGAVAASAANHVVLYFLPATREWIRPCVHAVAGPTLVAGVLLVVAPLLPLDPVARGILLPVLLLAAAWATGLVGARDVRALRAALDESAGLPRDAETEGGYSAV